MKYVIIGAGPAGMSAVKTILDKEPAARITLISDEDLSPYSRILITHYLEGKINRDDLFIFDEELYQHPNVEFKKAAEVAAVYPESKLVCTSLGEEISFDKLLIASGGTPKRPSQSGMDGQSVFTVRSLEDVEKIREKAVKSRDCVLLGGGMVSIKMLQALNKYGLNLSVIISSGHIMSQVLDREGAEIVAAHLKSNGINIMTGESARAIIDDQNQKLIYLDTEKIRADLVVIGKGVSPNIDFINRYKMKSNRGIVVDEYLRTSEADIYAAGDVAETYNILENESGVNAIWPNAVEQGRIAAMNMMGINRSYSGNVPMNSVEIFGLPVISVGIVKNYNNYEEISDYNSSSKVYRRFLFRGDNIIGAVLIGDVGNAGVYRQLIKNKKEIRDKEALLDKKFGLVDYIVS